MKETLYTFSFPYDIDIMVPWRENPERYRKIQGRGKRQQSESWSCVRFTDRKWKVTFWRDSMHEGRQRRWSLPSQYMPEHDNDRDEEESMNIGQSTNAFQICVVGIQTSAFTKSEQTPKSPCNSHHPLGWKYIFLYMKMNWASNNGIAGIWRWLKIIWKRKLKGSWGKTRRARETERNKEGKNGKDQTIHRLSTKPERMQPGKSLPAVKDVRWIQHKAVRKRQKGIGGGGGCGWWRQKVSKK